MQLLPIQFGIAVKVDDDVYAWASKFSWKLTAGKSRKRYVYRQSGCDRILLHREIMGNPRGLLVDHRYGDTLDCRRQNLRVATAAQNAANRFLRPGQLRGVKYRKRFKLWEAVIFCGGIRYVIGRFTDAIDAMNAYDQAARMLRGDFAVTHSGCSPTHPEYLAAHRSREFLAQKLHFLRSLAEESRVALERDRHELIVKIKAQRLATAREKERDRLQQWRLAAVASRRRAKSRLALPLGRPIAPQAVSRALGVPLRQIIEWMQAGKFGTLVNQGSTRSPAWRISARGFNKFKAIFRVAPASGDSSQ